jgi:hypothetical protein
MAYGTRRTSKPAVYAGDGLLFEKQWFRGAGEKRPRGHRDLELEQ